MSTHGARRLAALLAGVSLAALLATVALLIPNAEGRSLTEYGVNGVFGLVLGASYPIVGWLIASRRPGNPIGWIMLAVGLSQSAEAFATNYAVYGLETVHTAIPFLDLAAWIEVWAWAPGFLLLGIVVLLFPDGELPSPRWRPIPWIAGLSLVLMILPEAVVAWGARAQVLIEGWGPAAHDAPIVIADMLQTAGALLSALVALAALASVIVRFRRSTGIEHEQLKWFAYASVSEVAILALALTKFVPSPVDMILAALVAPLVPIAVGIAILRYRLYEIDRLVSRTVGWAILTGLLVAVFLGAAILLQAVLAQFTNDNTIAIAASTLVAFALAQPLRRRVQRAVDRRFDRARYDGQQTLDAFAEHVRSSVDLGTLSAMLATTAGEAVRPAGSVVWLSRRPAR